jgi:hypothetical protein
MDALFTRIATLHGVSIEDIEIARTQRNSAADFVFVVLPPMAIGFVLISNGLSKRIFRSIDRGLSAACVTVVASVLVTVLCGNGWGGGGAQKPQPHLCLHHA